PRGIAAEALQLQRSAAPGLGAPPLPAVGADRRRPRARSASLRAAAAAAGVGAAAARSADRAGLRHGRRTLVGYHRNRLVSRPRGSWHKSRSAAPGWQGATTENIGNI